MAIAAQVLAARRYYFCIDPRVHLLDVEIPNTNILYVTKDLCMLPLTFATTSNQICLPDRTPCMRVLAQNLAFSLVREAVCTRSISLVLPSCIACGFHDLPDCHVRRTSSTNRQYSESGFFSQCKSSVHLTILAHTILASLLTNDADN